MTGARLRDPAVVAVVAVCAVAALVLAGLPLAYVGAFHVALVLLLGVAVAAGLVWLLDLGRGAVGEHAGRWWGAAYLLAAASALVNGRLAAEHAVADRDPGVYAMTARWLVLHHDLTMPPAAGPFAGQLSAGLTATADGDVQFQGVHGLPVLQAVGDWVLGEVGLYRTPAALAGLALLVVFGLARELLRPAWALVATALLAVSLPFVYVARDGFTESLMLILLAGGAWMLVSALRVASWRRAALAGVLFGATACARVDFDVYGLPLALIVMWLGTLPSGRGGAWRAALLAGLVPGVAIGLIDVAGRSGAYWADQRGKVALIAAATAAVVVVVMALARSRRVRSAFARHRARVAAAGAVALVIAAGVAVALPRLATAHDAELMRAHVRTFGELQRQEGVHPIDPDRTFYEHAGHWLAWYEGWPLVVLGIAGAALLVWRVVRGRARAVEGVVLALAVVPLAIIVVNPSIFPDQPWAARRLVPFALPGMLMLATGSVAWALERARGSGAVAAGMVLAVGGAALFVPAVVTTGRIARFQQSAGLQRTIDAACAAAPANAALLVLREGNLADVLPGALTTWCEVPASGPPQGSQVAAVAAAWRAQGRELWGVAATETALRQAGFTPVARGRTVMRRVLRPRLLGAPTETDAQTYELVVGRPG